MFEAGVMSADERAALAGRIDGALRGVDGVRNLYRSGSLISNLLRVGVKAMGVGVGDDPIVKVVSGPEGMAVEASIGVDLGTPSGAVLREAHGAVAALLRAEGRQMNTITLTVVYVQAPVAA